MIKFRTSWSFLILLLCCLLELSGCHNKPITLQDSFENGHLADFWLPGDYGSGRYEYGAVSISSRYARSGNSSVGILLKRGFIRQDGGDGHFTERSELDSGKHSWLNKTIVIKFSILVLEDFPIVDNRLVISQLKQQGISSPIFAQRYIGGVHFFTVQSMENPDSDTIKFELPDLVRNKWHDFIFKVYLTEKPSGYIAVWMDGARVVDYRGKTSLEKGGRDFYHKFGLYRDEWDEPMTLYFDEFLISDDPAYVDAILN
jgi:hypothetical protein